MRARFEALTFCQLEFVGANSGLMLSENVGAPTFSERNYSSEVCA
jgi:hypothetical protein